MSGKETRWLVHTLPRNDGIEFHLTLSTPTDDPETLTAIEHAAAVAGMAITRLDAA